MIINDRSGMTLLEVMVSLFIFGFTSAALIGLFLAGSRALAVAHHDVAAVNVAQGILEQVKTIPENQLGVAQSGTEAAIRLGIEASDADDYYSGMMIAITGGTGAGQVRRIADYDGAERVAAVDQPWETVPDVTSEYAVFEGFDSAYIYQVIIGQPHTLTGELCLEGELRTITVTVSYVSAGGCNRKIELTGERLKRW